MALALHGGAGAISQQLLSPQRQEEYRQGLRQALTVGTKILTEGGTAMDAVSQTVVSLENCPLFNAGKGAVFTADETIELDASIMCGQSGAAGAVAGVKTLKNPILGARIVLEHSPHVFLVGKGADEYGLLHGAQQVPPSYFETETRREQLHTFQAENRIDLDHNDDAPQTHSPVNLGTVGAVALDQEGNLAAATSTGGMTNKEYGRVGDSPLIGSGTWASNSTCAISCTGQGEYFILGAVARDIDARMRYGGETLEQAAVTSLTEHVMIPGGQGGLIAVDKTGKVVMPFNSLGMYRASWTNLTGQSHVSIWKRSPSAGASTR